MFISCFKLFGCTEWKFEQTDKGSQRVSSDASAADGHATGGGVCMNLVLFAILVLKILINGSNNK